MTPTRPTTALGRAPVRPVAVGVALLLDELLGEPPVSCHPVVGMGAYLRGVARCVPAGPAARAVTTGGLAWATGATAATAWGVVAARAASRLPWPVAAVIEGALLWPLLSGRMLRREVAAVEAALARSTDAGRAQVSRLVSRDTSTLDAEQVRAAALGSLSENLSDSVVAPLLGYALGGLPAAAAYRYVNTADAMWGYRTPRWQHAGRVAARADDVANLLPARLTGLLLLGAHGLRDGGLARLREQARLTPSPNGGWPMGALALRQGIRLTKPGVYDLNPAGRAPTADDTGATIRRTRLIPAVGGGVAAVVAAAHGIGLARR